MKEGQQAAGQLGRRRLAFGRILEKSQGGDGLAVNALVASGLVLFVITFAVNFTARSIVAKSERTA